MATSFIKCNRAEDSRRHGHKSYTTLNTKNYVWKFNAVKLVKKSHRNIFPVVTQNNELLGIITLDDIREIMFDPDSQKNVIISTLMHKPPAVVNSDENMQYVMTLFEKKEGSNNEEALW